MLSHQESVEQIQRNYDLSKPVVLVAKGKSLKHVHDSDSYYTASLNSGGYFTDSIDFQFINDASVYGVVMSLFADRIDNLIIPTRFNFDRDFRDTSDEFVESKFGSYPEGINRHYIILPQSADEHMPVYTDIRAFDIRSVGELAIEWLRSVGFQNFILNGFDPDGSLHPTYEASDEFGEFDNAPKHVTRAPAAWYQMQYRRILEKFNTFNLSWSRTETNKSLDEALQELDPKKVKRNFQDSAPKAFDPWFYVATYLDVRRIFFKGLIKDPYEHYLQHGRAQGRNTYYMGDFTDFDEVWYLNTYPDVAELIRNKEYSCAAEHYARKGWFEQRGKNEYTNDQDIVDWLKQDSEASPEKAIHIELSLGRLPKQQPSKQSKAG